MKELRDYQQQARDSSIEHLYVRDFSGSIIHLATGLGKTVTGIEVTRSLFDQNFIRRMMFTVNMRQLVHQGYNDFKNQYPTLLTDPPNGFKLGLGKVMGKFNQADAAVTIVTPQTLSDRNGLNGRLDEVLQHGPIDLLIIDEAHYAISKSYLMMIDRLRNANPKMKILGQTATPFRNDGLALAQVFDTICISRNLKWGIDNGYLSDLRVLRVETNIELPDGKGSIEERAKVLDVKNWTEIMIESYLKHGEERQGAYFLPSVQHSEALSQAFNDAGIPSAHICDQTKDKERDHYFKQYRANKLRMICNYGVLAVGWDMPQVGLIGFARPTDNPVLATQILGRGTRKFPGKVDCLVLDYTLAGIEIVTAGTLAGHYLTEEGEKVEDPAETETIDDGVMLKDLDVLSGKHDNGKGVLVTPKSLFRQSRDAWYADPNDPNFFSMSAQFKYEGEGSGNRDLVFGITVPHYGLSKRIKEGIDNGLKADQNNPKVVKYLNTLMDAYKVFAHYTMWEIEKIGMSWQVNPIPVGYGTTFDEVLDNTIERVAASTNPLCSKKTKSWRYKEPTDGQLKWLSGTGISPMSRGEASKAITHLIVKKPVKQLLNKLQTDCGKYGEVEHVGTR